MTIDEMKDMIRVQAEVNGLDKTLDALADLYYEMGQLSEDGIVVMALKLANDLLTKENC